MKKFFKNLFCLVLFLVFITPIYTYSNTKIHASELTNSENSIDFKVVYEDNNITPTPDEKEKLMRVVHRLSYWYATVDNPNREIAYWRSIPSYVYVCYLNGNNKFLSAMESAITNWNNALGINMRYQTEDRSFSTSGGIIFYGGTLNELQNLSCFNIYEDFGPIGSPKSGYAKITCTRDGYSYVDPSGNTVIASYISKVRGYVLDKGDSATINQYIKSCTHELGHALGYLGHSNSANDIMYNTASSVTSLTIRDKNHIRQIYEIW